MGYVLSGGQRRKVEIARCLASKPKLILLDEPFAGIDPLAIEDIKNVLKSLSDKGICILLTDHNLRETIDICNYSIVIKDGSILDKGEKDYLINSSLIKEEYFGTVFDWCFEFCLFSSPSNNISTVTFLDLENSMVPSLRIL